MIDTSKYEGHTPIGFWRVVGQGEPEDAGEDSQHTPYWMCFDKVAQGDSRADRNRIQDALLLLEEVKRLREKNRIQRKILDAYSQYRDARYEDCETWMLEKGFRVMVRYGDEEQSEWKAEVE